MLCEKCSREIEVVACGACGESVARLGPFCYHCGLKLGKEAGEAPADAGRKDDDVLDLSDRILCSDGTCIGVIDERGVCKVCGKPYTPEE